MLDSFRKASQTWPIKLLFALLILSFGIWGIGDVIRSQVAGKPAIIVGSKEFSGADVADHFHRDVDRMSQAFGSKLTTEQAMQFGLLQRTTQQMVDGALLDQAASRLHLGVDDESLRRAIAAIPAFQSQLKMFDKGTYLRVLASMNMTEKQFVALEKSDLARTQLIKMITGGVSAPVDMAAPLYRYQAERRVAEYVLFAADKAYGDKGGSPPVPDQELLHKYYDDHKAQFQQPEFRGVTLLVVHAADLAAQIHPTDTDIEKAYEARLGEFQTAEKRSVEQVLFADQAAAQGFADSARQSKDFNQAAKQAGQSATDLGTVSKAEMPIPELAEATFAAPEAGTVGPVQSSLGWHVLQVRAITKGSTKPMAEVRNEIVQALVKDETTNRLYQLSTKLEDAIGGGGDIEEAAKTLGLNAVKLAAVDDHGREPGGKPTGDGVLTPGVLATLFQTVPGGTSDVVALPKNDGYYVLHVDKVVPATLRPFDEARPQAVIAWQAEQRSAAARRQAEAAAERVRQGEPLAALAGQLKVETTRPFQRNTPGQLPPALVAEMFQLPSIGGVAVVNAGADSLVARLKEIQSQDPAGAAFEASRGQLANGLADDLMQEYLVALKKDIGVQVNMAVIDQQFVK